MVKLVLTLSHGQADVESGFSMNKHVLGTDRSRMNQNTLVAVRTLKDFVAKHASVEKLANSISQDMVKAHVGSHAKCVAAQEESANTERESVRKRAAQREEDEAEEGLEKCRGDRIQAEKMITEANERIQSAIGKVDEIRTAHAILNAGNNLLSQAREQEDELRTKVSKFKKN